MAVASVAYATTTVTKHTTLVTVHPDSTTYLAKGKCPVGTKVVGGGGKLSDNVNDYLQGAYPQKSLFVAGAWRSSSEVGDSSITAFALCLKGTVSVPFKSKTLPNDSSFHSATARCPSGTGMTGGGIKLGDDVNDYDIESYPSGLRAWTAGGWRDASQSSSSLFTVYAICVRNVTTSIHSKQVTLADDNTTHAATVKCPRGTSVTGGGAQLADTADDIVQGTYPASKTSWTGEAYRNGTGAGTFKVYALCIK